MLFRSLANIIYKFCKENGYDIKIFYRMAVNCFCHYTAEPAIHDDHAFPHYVFLMYLNDFDEGYTSLYDENDVLIQKIVPSKYKAVIYTGPHKAGYPALDQHKFVLVATFGTDLK